MKVKIFNKYLQSWASKILSFTFGIATTMLTFFDVPLFCRKRLFLIIIISFVFVYIYKCCKVNHLSHTKISINYNDIIIKKDDIFSEEYSDNIKIIPFNEFFDTQVDNRIISENSLNGKFINKMLALNVYKNITELSNKIKTEEKNDTICKLLSANEERKLGGKNKRYELGSLCYLKENYCLLAFARFDKNNNAYLTNKDYIYSLLNMWDNLNKSYNQRNIVIPLLGGGITRFSESNSGNAISNQELLKMILTTLKWSNKKFNCTITILISETKFKQIDIFDIQETCGNL